MREEKVSISDHESPGEIRGFFKSWGKYIAVSSGFLLSAAAFSHEEKWRPYSTEAFHHLGNMGFSQNIITFEKTKTKFQKINSDIYKSDRETSEFCGLKTYTYLKWKRDGKYLDIHLYEYPDTKRLDSFCAKHSYVR